MPSTCWINLFDTSDDLKVFLDPHFYFLCISLVFSSSLQPFLLTVTSAAHPSSPLLRYLSIFYVFSHFSSSLLSFVCCSVFSDLSFLSPVLISLFTFLPPLFPSLFLSLPFPPPSVPPCLCFTSYRVVPLLVSILFAACESISRNKNFTNPINYAHFIFITRLHRPRRRDNSLMIRTLSWDVSLPSLTPPSSSPVLLPLPPLSCCIRSRIVNEVSDSAMMDVTTRHFEKNLRPDRFTSKTTGWDQ